MNKRPLHLIALAAIIATARPPSIPAPPMTHPAIDETVGVGSETTIAVISGAATPDGRAMIWKNRDRRMNPDQEYAYFDGGDYRCIALINAGDTSQAFAGVNETGFAIGNTNSYNFPDTVAGADDDGTIIKLALQTCRNAADFQAILDSTNESGRTLPSNYGVIDAEGAALIFEASAGDYTTFDASDTTDAPDGFLARANFSYSGGDTGRWSQWRHDRAYQLIINAIAENNLTPEYVITTVSRDLALEDLDPYPLPFDSVYAGANYPRGFIPDYTSINRNITRSVTVVQGVLEDEDPLLTTLYAVPGQPILCLPVPLWVGAAEMPVELDGEPTSMLCDLSLYCERYVYNHAVGDDAVNTYVLRDGEGGGLLAIVVPTADTILARTRIAMADWREDFPDAAAMADFQNRQAQYAVERLREWRGRSLFNVPRDYDSIQDAIDAADHGDTVLIHPGVYPAPIDFRGRNIVVGSLYLTTGDPAYIDSTVIDGARSGRSAAVFRNGETREAMLVGITIRNDSTGFGGGVYINNASPTLSRLVIRDNLASRNGGGIYCTQASHPALINVTMVNNTASDQGGGIQCNDQNTDVTAVNCIIRSNRPAALQGWLEINYSNVEGGYVGAGNIDADPLFVDPENGDYRLGWANFPVDDGTRSPCIDAGNPASPPDRDLTRADIGAFYFNQGRPQNIQADREQIAFENIQVGSFAHQPVTITNTGERTLTVHRQSVEYIAGPPFIYISGGGGAFALAGGEAHETVISFAPQFEAEHFALFHIDSDDPDQRRLTIGAAGLSLEAAEGGDAPPARFGIASAYPNPFNDRIFVRYGLEHPSLVRVAVHDILGREAELLLAERQTRGYHAVSWTGGGQPSGVFFLSMTAEGSSSRLKVIKVK